MNQLVYIIINIKLQHDIIHFCQQKYFKNIDQFDEIYHLLLKIIDHNFDYKNG